jgi:hypothetical protein
MIKEYIYLDNNGNILYTSRNLPMDYEDQTDCIMIQCPNEYDLDRILDMLIPETGNNLVMCHVKTKER